MKAKTVILVALVSLFSLRAQSELAVSFSVGSHHSGSSVGTSVFYSSGHIHNQLSSYGSWFRLEPFGMVWQPREAFGVPQWHPYGKHGCWETINGSRRWTSRYAWGKMPYRHGRWHHCSKRGWLWVPGALYVVPAPRRIVKCRPPVVRYHRPPAVNYHRPPAVNYHRPHYSTHGCRPPVSIHSRRHRPSGYSRHRGPRRMGHGELRSRSSRTVHRPSHASRTRSSSSSSSRANQFHMQMRNRR
ncbi:MAG: hypothetical protein ISS35_05540 [Kiritimatiellae bacterium]|nr:hypothetical protein [Kiritimatiellia bacterium]